MRTGEVFALTWDDIDLENGIEIRDVADILGHRNVETTENYYISSTKKSKRLATDVFDKITKSEIIEEIIKYK
jgi:integrase